MSGFTSRSTILASHVWRARTSGRISGYYNLPASISRSRNTVFHGCKSISSATAAATSPDPVYRYSEDVPFVPPPRPTIRTTEFSDRMEAIKKAKPFSEFLTDNYNREHNYLRISVTERCNLRCAYIYPSSKPYLELGVLTSLC